jgi:hypothetical protein
MQSVHHAAYKEYMTNIISPDLHQNPKRFWSFSLSRWCENFGVAPLKNEHGTLLWDDISQANILNDQFASVFSYYDHSRALPDKGPSLRPDIPTITIGYADVTKPRTDREPHKASGPDSLYPRLLKETACEITSMLSYTRAY